MTITQDSYIEVRKRLVELGCASPRSVAILPMNFDKVSSVDEFRFPFTMLTTTKLLQAVGLSIDDIMPHDSSRRYTKNRADDWILPTLFLTYYWLAQQPAGLEIIITAILEYAERFYGAMPTPRVSMSIVREHPDGVCEKISYDGPVKGLRDLTQVVQSTSFLGRGDDLDG